MHMGMYMFSPYGKECAHVMSLCQLCDKHRPAVHICMQKYLHGETLCTCVVS